MEKAEQRQGPIVASSACPIIRINESLSRMHLAGLCERRSTASNSGCGAEGIKTTRNSAGEIFLIPPPFSSAPRKRF